ncbi:hypothetical protein [Neolewinella litorea]|uniref:Uncharacterized protein n=1 Tax=Neolewinella litorea TaxID=2562452 RepID=A0A4S4N5H4_9BACT|nr:hypothetical protein [Neolewinella litorea]THH34336.1 hypothetical protein E4021_17815 [Neolewinella litorea]
MATIKASIPSIVGARHNKIGLPLSLFYTGLTLILQYQSQSQFRSNANQVKKAHLLLGNYIKFITMELKIVLPAEKSKQSIVNLKNYMDKVSIDGVYSIEIDRAEHFSGQLGYGNILNSITTVVEAATEPLVELVKCLEKYVSNYRTVITISTKHGKVEIKHGRSMSPDELKEVVSSIQQNDK